MSCCVFFLTLNWHNPSMDVIWLTCVTNLSDIFDQLNILNLPVQCRKCNHFDQYDKIAAISVLQIAHFKWQHGHVS